MDSNVPCVLLMNLQVNLEYLGRVVFNTEGLLYPDSVVGTDSHTTMIDGLGVAGWGVGGIEAEAAMLGQVRCANLYCLFYKLCDNRYYYLTSMVS